MRMILEESLGINWNLINHNRRFIWKGKTPHSEEERLMRDAMIRNQNRRTLLEIQLEAPLWWWFCALDNGHQLIKSARLSKNWIANLRGQAIQGALKMRIPFQTKRSVLEVDKIYKWTVWFRYDSSTGANRQTTCKLRVATYRRSSDNERSNEWAFKCRCTNTTKQIGLSGSKRIFSD